MLLRHGDKSERNMQHFLPLYLILCVLPGIAALTILSALVSRLKNRGLTYYLISYSCFTVSILVNLVMFYLGINISEEISSGIFILISLGIPFSILMHTALPLAVNELIRPKGKRWIDLTVIITGAIELVAFCTPLLLRYSRETQTIIFGPIFPFVGVIQFLSIGYSIVMVIIGRKTIMNRTVRRYILTMAAIIVFFLPAIAYDQFYFLGVKSIDTVPVAVILSPFFYFVLSLATLIFGIRGMMSPANTDDRSSSPDRDGRAPSGEIDLQNLAESSGLTDREIAIISLITGGLGNKQIALELHISSKTVGNHIYNIYRKLNINSRYELLALLK